VETVSGSLPDPAQLLVCGLRHAGLDELGVDSPFVQVVVDVDDIGLARREAEHLAATSAEQKSRKRLLDRLRGALEALDRVVLALERGLAAGEELLADRDRLGEPLDPNAGAAERHARR